MKDYLKAEIDGRTFLKTYLMFFIPILILSALASPEYGSPGGAPIFSLLDSYLTLLLEFAFFCYLVTRVTFRNAGFPFSGSVGGFAPKGALWLFLSMITLGIYGPWFLRNYIGYVLENLSWNSKKASFLSEPGSLLKSMLLLLFLPMAVLSGVFAAVYYGRDEVFSAASVLFLIVGAILVIILTLSFTWIYLRWLVNFEFSGYRIRFSAERNQTIGFLAGQVVLIIITAGIYSPAAWVNIYRFITSHIVFLDGAEEKQAVLGFDGGTGEGFLLFWGQILLCIVTIGFYGSWAMARIGNWILNRTYLEGEIEF